MRDLPDTNTTSCGPQERKINPLGRPNKRFLGRTIHTALRYNKREIEKTQANCRQRLQELNNKHERRYRGELQKERSTERHKSRSRSRKKHKRRRKRSPRATRSSRSSSRSSSSSSDSHNKHKKKHRRKRKKLKKRKQRHHSSRSASINEENQLMPVVQEQVPASYYAPSNSLALAVAMAYSQALATRQSSLQSNEPTQPASEFSDIINELMSDEEDGQERRSLPALSITSSSDEVEEVPTIHISSYSEDSPGTTASESDAEMSNSDSCIALDDNADNDILKAGSCSDIEIIEPERGREPEQPNRKSEESSTVDLTQD